MICTRYSLFIWLACLAGLSTINCDVDESKPDLGMYHLRPVHGPRQTKAMLTSPITDYGSAVIIMRRSLFSSDSLVRCSTYAHLLKLIDEADSLGNREIKQDTVNALAVTVDNDREHYGELFKLYKPHELQKKVKEAIEQLEGRLIQTPSTRDTWMELIDCAILFELNIDSFLLMPARAAKIESYKKVRSMGGVSVEREPRANVFSEQEILQARLKVESLDDDELKELRSVLRAPKDQTPAVEASMPESDTRGDKDAPANSSPVIEIEVPGIVESETKFDVADPKEIEASINALNFWIRRVEILDATPKRLLKKEKKLALDDALDFVRVWKSLEEKKLDPLDPLAARVASFLNDERNAPVYKRLQEAVDNFSHLILYTMNLARREGNWKSVDAFELTYKGLLEGLEKVDPVLDNYDAAQAALEIRSKKLKEFQTINKFINDGFW